MPEAKKKQADTKTSKEPADVQEPEFEKAPPLAVPRFGLAEEMRNVWRCSVPEKTTPEQCLEEGFWANVANLLQPGDMIQVVPDNLHWRLNLDVVASGNTWAQVAKLCLYDLTPARPHTAIPSRYKVQFAGAHHKWRVLRDDEPLKDGFASESLARRWAQNHEAAVNR